MASGNRKRHNSKKLIPSLSEPRCTYQKTKTSYVAQPFYRCLTCFTGANDGICFNCLEKCHQGHDTMYAGSFRAFCDCGLSNCKSQCKIGTKCTYDLYGKVGKQQDWYHCHTCWGEGESQFGCCEVCVDDCHKGHKVKYAKESSDSVCDCGDNKHKNTVCTFHITGNQHILQPFYSCRSCFPNSLGDGCCYQCMKVCHAGHSTCYKGVMKAFCDCGLSCCRISCKISKP